MSAPAMADGGEDPRAASAVSAARRRQTVRLGVLFGTLYFIQGIGEPSEGLITQPVRSLLDSWHHTPRQIGLFMMLLSLPWAVKPLFGILTDFVPLGGRRRQSYLVLVNAAALAGFGWLALVPPQPGSAGWLLVVLLMATVGVAFADVVIDALMVERGQPLGITGRLQSIQWASMYAATVIAGSLGGYLTATGRQAWGFGICAAVMVPALGLSLFLVREPRSAQARPSWRAAGRALADAVRTPGVLAVGAFLFLWSFNPFSSTVLQLHMKYALHFDDQFYGNTVAVQSVASMVASVAYGFYCRRLTTGVLIHLSIVGGILSTIGYWALFDEWSAMAVTVAVGFTYMTATLIQLDLAARICPPETAGTVFALLMALSNLGMALSIGVGGYLYEQGLAWWDSRVLSFNVLVGVGAGFTACCWLLWPWLRRVAWSPGLLANGRAVE